MQKLIIENFVPLAMDDFYMRRQEDEAGRFFRRMAGQGPRKGVGGATRQGRYAFSADGTLLGYNNNRGPDRMIAMLRRALAKFESLPKEKDVTDATDIGTEDARFKRFPPEEGAIVKVYTRVLEPTDDGEGLQHCAVEDGSDGKYRHHGFGAAIDHLWIQKAEVLALAKLGTGTGATFSLPESIATRIARFHLTDNTRGEPPHWKRDEIRTSQWTCTPERDGKVGLKGKLHLETADGSRGFEGTALGSYTINDDKLLSFDLVVLGDFWGEGRYTRGARPGRNPIGFSFRMPLKLTAADRIPPQGARWLEGYYQAHRQ